MPLTGNTSGDDDDVGILEGGLGAVVGGEVAGGFLMRQVSARFCGVRGVFMSLATTSAKPVLATYGGGGDVREIGSDTGGVDDIVESELVNERRELEEEGQGLRHMWSAMLPSQPPIRAVRRGISHGQVGIKLTCPIPPAAPATTVHNVSFLPPLPQTAEERRWTLCSLPALTILKSVDI